MTPTPLHFVLWTCFAFLCGSLPFSVWLSRLLVKKDARQVGDHNPGATNALKVGGWRVGLPAYALDISKGAFPVGMAYIVWGWRGWEIVPLALAPLLGSAFSPFLGFRGGKSLSVSLGVWIGLTLWEAPLVILATLSAAFLLQTVSGWAVVAALLATAAYLALAGQDAWLWVFLGLQAVLLLWKQRFDLRRPPRLRRWLSRRTD